MVARLVLLSTLCALAASDDASCSAPRDARLRLADLIGPPRLRNDTWLRSVALLLSKEHLPAELHPPLQEAATLLRGPVLPDAYLEAWRKLGAMAAAAPENVDVAVARALFAWRYHPDLLHHGKSAEIAEAAAAVAAAAGQDAGRAGFAAGLLGLQQDGRSVGETIRLLRLAYTASPEDDAIILRLATALANGARDGATAALALMRKRVKAKGDARLLAAFGFLAATHPEKAHQDKALFALKAAAAQTETRGGAEAAVFLASLEGKKSGVSFEECSRISKLERDLLFTPGACQRRLELGVRLQRISGIAASVAAGRRLLRGLAYECPGMAERFSGLGRLWLDGVETADGSPALGLSLDALAEVRQGIKDASYTSWELRAQREGAEESERSVHLDVLRAAEVVKGFGKEERRCEKPEALPTFEAPGDMDEEGCRQVRTEDFEEECLKEQKPCVLKRAAQEFLQKHKKGLGSLERWLEIAGNASVRFSFPLSGEEGGSDSLNSIEQTEDFIAREDVRESYAQAGVPLPDEEKHPWVLIRPPHWHLLFKDLVAWIKHQPRSIYMNQQMLADLGVAALAELRWPAWVRSAGLQLLSPSLWLASGVVTTGFHSDGPENLLAQLAGQKEILLSPPREARSLYYQEVHDVEATAVLEKDGSISRNGYRAGNRTSSGHSVVDVTKEVDGILFPLYDYAKGVKCHIDAGDVLYIPAKWHHAVLTTPDESCVGLSLNLWCSTGDLPDRERS